MIKINRRKTKVVNVGSVKIGGDNPIVIQAMAKTPTHQLGATINQIKRLRQDGALIVRLAVKDIKDARAIKLIKQKTKTPIIADIHFDYRLALESIKNGADKIRLNPGNINKKKDLRLVVLAAKKAKIPIRIGVNSGSVWGASGAKRDSSSRLVSAASSYIKFFRDLDFNDIVLSLKSSDILETVSAYRQISKLYDYPLHLGLTATGGLEAGIIKSSIAIGSLLLDGIGDTIRISLTDDPEEEVRVSRLILQSLGLANYGPQIISCPTCGRCEVGLVNIVKNLEKKLSDDPKLNKKNLNIAVMGCIVNGPGEAKEADLGIAFGKAKGALFKKGKIIKTVSEKEAVNSIYRQIKRFK